MFLESAQFPIAFLAALGCGLMAGLFFVFSNTVMKALARLEPRAGIAAMQGINDIIINPIFFVAFFGTAATCAITVLGAVLRWSGSESLFLLLGSVLYLVGTFGVTAAFNVPMNNRLARLDPKDPHSESEWLHYLIRWTAWNHVRSVTSLAGLGFLILGICGLS